MSIEFITLQTAPLNNINVSASSGWQDNLPLITISSDTVIPQDVEVQSLLHPTDLVLSAGEVQQIFDDMYDPSTRQNDYIIASGCFYHFFETSSDVEFRAEIQTAPPHQFDRSGATYSPRFGENTEYSYSYAIRFKTGNGVFENVYDPVYVTAALNIVSMPAQPDKDYFFITSSGVIIDDATTNLDINIYHEPRPGFRETAYPLLGQGIGQTAYELKIVDSQRRKQYDINGVDYPINDPIPVANTYTANSINITLPFTEINNANNVVYTDYYISLRYRGQDGDYTNYINFDTRSIREFEQTILDSVDLKNDNSFTKTWTIENNEFLIDETMSDKRRLSLDVYDIALTANNYYKTGRYESKYYALDNPLYTMFLVTDDKFPLGIGVDSIRYYVKFAELDPIRISPSNRDTETAVIDGKEQIIPKFMVLDKLDNNGINPEVKEITSTEPIYTFKIIIEFDVSSYVDTEAFIPPSIDSYECHVTDRKSFLRI